jgi:hypothetical protein
MAAMATTLLKVPAPRATTKTARFRLAARQARRAQPMTVDIGQAVNSSQADARESVGQKRLRGHFTLRHTVT